MAGEMGKLLLLVFTCWMAVAMEDGEPKDAPVARPTPAQLKQLQRKVDQLEQQIKEYKQREQDALQRLFDESRAEREQYRKTH